jgi:lipoprotein-releasing system permease protein
MWACAYAAWMLAVCAVCFFAVGSFERASVGWGVCVALASACGGYVCGARLKRMPTVEIFWGACAVACVCGVAAWPSLWAQGVASVWFRVLLTLPASVFLAGYWGGSLGVLWQDGVSVGWGGGYEGWVALRGMVSRHSSVLSTVTSISVVGVALGVWLVLVSLGVLSGFERDLESKLVGAHAHVVFQKRGGRVFDLEEKAWAHMKNAPGVRAVSPVLEAEVALAGGSNYVGGWVFGINPSQAPAVLGVLKRLQEGSVQALRAKQVSLKPSGSTEEFAAPARLPGMVLGAEMAASLGVTLGSHVRVLSPVLDVLTPVGVVPKSRSYEVVGIFSSKMYEYDARYAFVDLDVLRDFLEVSPHAVSGVQAVMDRPEDASEVGQSVLQGLPGQGYEALDWKTRNQTLFSALMLERVVAFVVLGFIILVASFSIVNTLTMSVFEKRKDIAILKTMGAHDTGIMKVFVLQGLFVGGIGIAIGALAAVCTTYALMKVGFSIPGDVYYIDALPVHLTLQDVVLVVVCAVMVVWNFAVFPAVRGAALLPVEGLRDG